MACSSGVEASTVISVVMRCSRSLSRDRRFIWVSSFGWGLAASMLRLAEAGMVGFERNRGFRVLRSAPADVAGIFHLRLLLEVPAARLAVRRMDARVLEELRAEPEAMRVVAAGSADE